MTAQTSPASANMTASSNFGTPKAFLQLVGAGMSNCLGKTAPVVGAKPVEEAPPAAEPDVLAQCLSELTKMKTGFAELDERVTALEAKAA